MLKNLNKVSSAIVMWVHNLPSTFPGKMDEVSTPTSSDLRFTMKTFNFPPYKSFISERISGGRFSRTSKSSSFNGGTSELWLASRLDKLALTDELLIDG